MQNRRQQILRVAFLLLNVALAAAVVAVGGTSVHRKVAEFQTVGFQAEPAPGGWEITAADPEASALRTGDVILLVNGAEASTIDSLREVLLRLPESQLMVERAGELEAIAFARPGINLDIPYLILVLIGTLYLLIGIYTLVKSREKHSYLFYLWCLAYTLVFLLAPGSGFDAFDRWFYGIERVARWLLPALTLHLFLVFPERLGSTVAQRRIVPFFYLPAAVLLPVDLDLILASGRWLLGAPTQAQMENIVPLLDQLSLYHLVLYSLAAALLLIYRVMRRDDWQERRQVMWVALGMGIGYLPLLAFLLLQELPALTALASSEWAESLAVLPLGIVPVTFAWAILRHKLWDIEIVVRDAAAYTATALLGILGFSLVNLAVTRGLSEELGMVRNLVSFGAGVMIAAMVVPARKRISSTLERLQYRRTFDQRQELAQLAGELLHERDLHRLCTALLEHLEDGLLLQRVNLYLGHEDLMVPVRPAAPILLNSGTRRLGSPDLPLDALGEPVWRSDVAAISGVGLPGGELTVEQQLYREGYRYAFPLTVHGRKVGLAVAGYKLDHKPLNGDDLALVRGLLNQAALAIENAQLLDELYHQLDEVGRLQQFNEGIIESSPAGIAVLDDMDRMISVNTAFRRLLDVHGQVDTGAALIHRRLEEVLPIRPLPRPGDGLVEVSYCDPGGEEHYLQLSVAELQGRSPGDLSLRVLVVHDVSQRTAMEAALREQERLASLGMLAAGVAHEVNTPITGISSYAQMLLDDTSPEDPRYRLLKKVEAQTFRASRIVNNLLTFARSRRDESQDLDLQRLLRETVDLLKERLSKRGVQVDWQVGQQSGQQAEHGHLDENGALMVHGNDGELQQVFTNLLINAIDAMSPDPDASNFRRHGGELRLRLYRSARAEGCGQVCVEIEDTGRGIPSERLEKIFQPFFSTKLSRGGTGLGLSISYDIVVRHGGTMEVDSLVGRGTRFTVRLPGVGPEADADASTDPGARAV